jgi:23S rRNA (uracil1939-C5)-methyltransferase
MLRTASTGEIMVLIQFFENDKANRELILDHLYEKFLKLHHYNVVNSKANDTYMIPILNYTKDATTY